MADLTKMLAARLADIYAGKCLKKTNALWNPDELLGSGTPAAIFVSMHPEHAFAKFLVEFQSFYTDAARGSKILGTNEFADMPFIGAKVLAGEPPVVVISQSSYSPKPGSITLWAMLFPFGPAAPEAYATTDKWKGWRRKYPKYQQTLCCGPADRSFGLDPETLVVTDACLPGCDDEHAFLSTFIEAFPRPRMILSLGKQAAERLNMLEHWHRHEARGNLPAGVPVVVSPFVWGQGAPQMCGPRFAAALEATRSVLA